MPEETLQSVLNEANSAYRNAYNQGIETACNDMLIIIKNFLRSSEFGENIQLASTIIDENSEQLLGNCLINKME
jgi:hypothetical protein